MRYASSLLAAALLLLTGAACSDAPTETDDPGTPVTFSTLAAKHETLVEGQWGSYDFEKRQNIVIHSEEDYAAFWQTLYNQTSEAPERPAVDFDTETVVAVMMGVQTSTGYIIEVEDVASADRSVRVRSTLTVPGSSCGSFAALTSPYHVIKVSVAATDFAFEDTQQTRTCR